ncbi:hypothetical protein ACQJ5A_00760 [Helicobacter pylori]
MPYNQNKAIRQENHITHNQKRLKTLLLAYFFFLSGALKFLKLKVFLNIIIKQALNLSLEPSYHSNSNLLMLRARSKPNLAIF